MKNWKRYHGDKRRRKNHEKIQIINGPLRARKIQNSNLSHLYDLQSYLQVYDETAEANFTPFSLLETLDYEYFYEEDQKKDEALILRDIKLFTIKNIADNFLNTFVDIKNSNFINRP